MQEKIILDTLTNDSVTVKWQKHIVQDEIEYEIGQPHAKAYVNSENGRQKVEAELPVAQRNAIFAIWGNSPTVNEH